MKKIILLFLVCLTAGAVSGAIQKEPYLIYTGTNTEMMVLWQMTSSQSCTLEWGTSTSYGSSTTTSSYGDNQHEHTITGLTPGVKYFYRVDTGAYFTGNFYAAPSTSATSVSFFAYGDCRNNPGLQDQVNAQMITHYTADPAFQTISLLSGDYVDRGRNETSWTQDWFNLGQANMMEFRATVPINGSMGNHETAFQEPDDGDGFAKYYPYPYESSAHYGSFDYGPVHFVSLDQYAGMSGAISGTQATWLENDLGNTSKEWKFLEYHAPAWTGSTRTNSNAQTVIHPICVTYGVDITFAGHEHFYTRAENEGVIHLTTGGGGAPADSPGNNYPYVVTSADSLHFMAVEINAQYLSAEAVDETGSVIDTFDVQHGPPDVDAPDPDPMTWATVPYDIDSVTVAMTATTATDPSGVEYYIACTAGGGNDSGWQLGTTYQDSGLSPETQYTYQAKARDKAPAQNETAWSTTASVTTPAMQLPGQATNPNPTNSETGVGVYVNLTWDAGLDTQSHDVYFGTSSPPSFIQNQPGTLYDPGTMVGDTPYYWRIDEKNVVGTTTGVEWSFTTGTASPPRSQYLFDGDFCNEIAGPCATDYGNASITNDAEKGQVLSLDGTGDYLDCGYDAIGGIEYAMTLACWVKTSDLAANDGIMANGYSWRMLGNGGTIKFVDSTLSVGTLIGTTNVADGAWHHIGVTYDSVAEQLAIYVDGDVDNSTSCTGLLNTWQGYENLIGWCSSGTHGYFNGLIEDARIYDRALPQPEMLALAGGGEPDTDPPAPDPMTWATEPYATGDSSIAMVATTATDASGIQYFFDCTAGGGNDSGWQGQTSYEDTGLSPDTQYTYTVTARDTSASQNSTDASVAKSATTDPPDTTAPTPDPATWATVPYATGENSIAMVATTATDVSGVEYYFDCTAGGGNDSAWQGSTNYEDTGLSPATQYTYTVTARDLSANQNATAASTAESATTDSPPLALPWSDDFESGNLTAGGWTISGAVAASTQSEYSGSYGAKIGGVNAWLEKAISTYGFTSIHLTYYRTTYGLDSGEFLHVEWFDGADWNPLESTQDTSFVYKDWTLPAGAADNADFKVRFLNDASKSNEYCSVDVVGITGTGGQPDTDPPSPDPMTWATVPNSTGETSIAMVADTATDTSGVEYYFTCTSGGGNNSAWQDSTSYEDTGLSASTQYCYTVTARDKSAAQNSTAASSAECATTDAPDTTAPNPDPTEWATVPYSTGSSSINMVATTATDPSGVEYYFTCTSGGGNDSAWQDSTSYEDTGLSSSTQYCYTVQARDKSAAQNATAASTSECATTDAGCSASTMHVQSIVCGLLTGCGPASEQGQVTVTIYDNCGDPVVGALVDGTFTGDYEETFDDVTTNGSGVATFTTVGCLKKQSYQFCVDDVTGSLTYSSGDNVETCDTN